MPWNIEVKLTLPSSNNMSMSGSTRNTGGPRHPNRSRMPKFKPDYLKVDTYLDTSDLALSSSGDITSDLNRFVKVRGIILGPDGAPLGKEVKSSQDIASCLMAGIMSSLE